MKYAKLGKTDIEVSRICVGCMSYGKASDDFQLWTLPPSLYNRSRRHTGSCPMRQLITGGIAVAMAITANAAELTAKENAFVLGDNAQSTLRSK